MNVQQAPATPGTRRAGAPHLPAQALKPALDGDIGSPPSDHDFIMMHAVYRASGGIARADELAGSLEEHACGDFVGLARLIVSRQIFSFQWHDSFWVPMFQFDRRSLHVKAGPRQVLHELTTVFDGWTLATWFAQPNGWLKEHRPIDLLDSKLAAVVEAARADRFIAAGW